MKNKVSPVIIELKPSKMMASEVGLFAARAIKQDQIVISAKAFSDERLISWEEFRELDKLTQQKIMDFCCGRKEGFYAPKDLNLISIAWHMNHSCAPNIGFDSKYNFVAMRSVKKGEELVWDYSYDETNPKFKLKCQCRSKNCRGVISGNDWRRAKELGLKTKYISSHLKKLIANELKSNL